VSPSRKRSLAEEATRLNEAFNHWIVHRTPFVIVKAAMTLDGKIATASGESKWITGEKARAVGMKLRQGADAILVGINTVLKDDPSLTVRIQNSKFKIKNQKRRIVLDPKAQIPLTAKLLNDEFAALTTIVVSNSASKKSVEALAKRAHVLISPHGELKFKNQKSKLDLRWLLKKLGSENVTSLLVEGGGETNALFLLEKLGQRIVFFYAPKIMGGRQSRKGVAGNGILDWADKISLREVEWKKMGDDLLLTARIKEG
ncbi:MAG: dihydrofolate reductase family protein, partial [Verrucomicrobiota bacterium]|nr:dihydrofolate reductase family protein [Verrucomicrobiota bacterium]